MKIINKIKNYDPPKCIGVIFFLFCTIAVFLKFQLDNDFWFLANTGKYIIHHGFPIIEPFTMHEGLSFVAQQWLLDIIFYGLYSKLSYYGIYIFLILINSLIYYFMYKLCMLLSDNKFSLSIILTTLFDILLIIGYITTRPQIIDYLLLIIEIYTLELYIRKKNNKLLLILPILSLLMINFHSSSWPLLFIFLLPYVVDSFKFKIGKYKSNGFGNKYFYLIILAMIIIGFINPYGLENMTYFLKSYGYESINANINEMAAFSLEDAISILLLIYIGINLLIYYFHKKEFTYRYFFLVLGTLFMSIMHYKCFPLYYIASFSYLAYLLRNDFNEYKEHFHYNLSFKIKYIALILLFTICTIRAFTGINEFKYPLEPIINYLDENNVSKDSKVYINYDFGGYLEYKGYKAYMDPRAEIFLKTINKKEDIFDEYINLTKTKNPKEYDNFINKYNFDYLILFDSETLYYYLENNKDYKIVLEDTSESEFKEKFNYRLYKNISLKD